MIYQGDARDVLPTLDAGSVQCVVTSPPYWGLRDYGVEGQIGLEPTPDAYVETLVTVFHEVRRVLRDDGTVWLNLGDSYATTPTGNRGTASKLNGADGAQYAATLDRYTEAKTRRAAIPDGLKPKDLCMIPARVALALQADGWYLRSDIIWAKGLSFCPSYAGSVMPESCTDRPTSAYEHMFLLTKQARYYYDVEAVRETAIHAGKVVTLGAQSLSKRSAAGIGITGSGNALADSVTVASGRNLRNVWAINPQPFREAHFATFPMALVEPCIKAGSSQKGQCVACRAPWVRVVGPTAIKTTKSPAVGSKYSASDQAGSLSGSRAAYRAAGMEGPPPRQITGWFPSCDCHAPTEPQTVLDPFAGSGTTGIVAARHGREFVGIELNPQYAQMAGESIDGPLFTEP